MDARIEAFLHYMSAERGASKNTIDAYRNDLTRFAEFAGERGGNGSHPSASKIDRDLITDYILWLKQQTYAAATVARKVAAVKSFCAFLLDHGDLTSNPTAAIDSPRAPKPVPRPMTTADVDALLREPPATAPPRRPATARCSS